MKTPKLINHQSAHYHGTDGTAYRGTIQVPRHLFDAVMTVLFNTTGWDYQGYTGEIPKYTMLKQDLLQEQNNIVGIRVHATRELVRILKLEKRYKAHNYLIELI